MPFCCFLIEWFSWEWDAVSLLEAAFVGGSRNAFILGKKQELVSIRLSFFTVGIDRIRNGGKKYVSDPGVDHPQFGWR